MVLSMYIYYFIYKSVCFDPFYNIKNDILVKMHIYIYSTSYFFVFYIQIHIVMIFSYIRNLKARG